MARRTGYADRRHAGQVLADAVADALAGSGRAPPPLPQPDRPDGPPQALVLGLARGGVPVAAEVAGRLGAELDVLVVRKVGVPWQPELAIGAVGPYDIQLLDGERARRAGVPPAELASVVARERRERDRREQRYRAGRPPPELAGRTVIVVDDGLATGASMVVAARAARSQGPARLVLAAPVGAPDTLARLADEADSVVCPYQPGDFMAVGQFYDDFTQVDDEQVLALLTPR